MTDIDFTNAGLASRAEGVEPEVVEEVVEESPAVEEVAEVADEVAPEEAVVEEDPAEHDPDGLVDTYEQRYAEAQKLIGRQGQELGDLRKAFEAFQQQQVPAVEERPAFQPASVDHQPVLDAAADPATAIDAYNYAAQHQPDLIPDVLAEVRFHDPALAERMQLDYVQHMLSTQTAQATQYVQSTTADQQSQKAVADYASSVDGWETIREEVASIIEEEPWLVGDGSPQAVQQGLRAATRMAQQARQVAAGHVQAQETARGVQQRQAAVVETGTAGAAPVVEETSAAEQIRAGIFAEDKRRRELF